MNGEKSKDGEPFDSAQGWPVEGWSLSVLNTEGWSLSGVEGKGWDE